MKNFKFASALFVSVALLTSCEKAEIVPTKSSITTTVVDTNFDDSFANRHSGKTGFISTNSATTQNTSIQNTSTPTAKSTVHVSKEALDIDK